MTNPFSMQRTVSVARKEFLHIIRDPATLFFALFIPVLEMFMLGYAIDTNVRNVRTVVFDAAGTKESARLLEAFENSEDFKIVRYVYTDEALRGAIVAGQARVGIKIPARLLQKPRSPPHRRHPGFGRRLRIERRRRGAQRQQCFGLARFARTAARRP